MGVSKLSENVYSGSELIPNGGMISEWFNVTHWIIHLDADSRWNKPSTFEEWDESCFCYRGPEFDWGTFISHDQLHRRDFLKNDDLITTLFILMVRIFLKEDARQSEYHVNLFYIINYTNN